MPLWDDLELRNQFRVWVQRNVIVQLVVLELYILFHCTTIYTVAQFALFSDASGSVVFELRLWGAGLSLCMVFRSIPTKMLALTRTMLSILCEIILAILFNTRIHQPLLWATSPENLPSLITQTSQNRKLLSNNKSLHWVSGRELQIHHSPGHIS